MRTYTGNQNVEPGLYFNLKRLRVTTVETRGPLPGTEDDRYRRLPMLVMLASAPLLGLAFVIFLPFIGFAMVAYLLADKAAELAAKVATATVRVLRPGWAPALSFLSRSKPIAKGKPVQKVPDAWAEDVEHKLNENETDGPKQ